MEKMKKIIILAAILAAGSFISCKKKYNCVCKSGLGIGADKGYSIRAKSQTDAQNECKAKEESDFNVGYTCTL